jgi:RAB protein geranylgeranyltransferase component A
MASLGRYGAPGAFLVPLYGASELPQAFCRTAVRPTCTKEQRCVN